MCMLVLQYICMESCIINCNSFSTSFSVIWNNLGSVHCEISRLCWSFLSLYISTIHTTVVVQGSAKVDEIEFKNMPTCSKTENHWCGVRTSISTLPHMFMVWCLGTGTTLPVLFHYMKDLSSHWQLGFQKKRNRYMLCEYGWRCWK
jgi:hypothetical protein